MELGNLHDVNTFYKNEFYKKCAEKIFVIIRMVVLNFSDLRLPRRGASSLVYQCFQKYQLLGPYVCQKYYCPLPGLNDISLVFISNS